MQRSMISLFSGLVFIAALSFGIYAYIAAHGYSAFFALVDDPLGFAGENDSSIEEVTDESKAAVPQKKQRRPDPTLYTPDGSLQAPIGGLNGRDIYNPPIGMQRVYKLINISTSRYYPPRYHNCCCVLMPSDDPRHSYKTIAFGDEWCLLSQEEALRKIADRYRNRAAQTVYIFKAKQATFWPDDISRASATVLSDGSVRIKETSQAER